MAETSAAIAIIGMACRFPGADTVDAFWRNLRGGVESIRRFTDEELAQAGVPETVRRDPAYVPAGGALDGIEMFDAEFFGFTPRDAEITDPQQRLFLEVAWEALEAGGYASEHYEGRIGVFAGAGISTYLVHNLLQRPDVLARVGDLELLMANKRDYVPSRVAYKFNLRGPAINANTACSTGLANVHLACQSLLAFESDMALAGGVSVQVPQDRGYLYVNGGILSPDGHCRAFDASAAGTVSANGAGVVLLKRLDDAIADRDTIRAVILGSAMNNDGSAKAGFTAPSVQGQAAVITEAQAIADAAPATIGYVEAHGTGTPVGDPIELAALNQVFAGDRGAAGPCAIGSVKTNFGHLDEAAGVAGLIKAALALEHAEIPPSLNFTAPNPACHLDTGPFRVAARLQPWPARSGPRRAGVSSFGLGGTNVHAVLEDAPAALSGPSRAHHLIALSARSATALQALTNRLADAFETDPGESLADAAYTLAAGRRHFAHRRAAVCGDPAQAVQALRHPAASPVAVPSDGDEPRPVIFAFSGHGTPYPGMARGLYKAEPVFRREFDRCAEIVSAHLHRDLRQCLWSADEDAARAALRSMTVAQPLLFALQYALAAQWRAWGVEPAALIGHSAGEYTAACVAGTFSVEDAIALLVERGRLMDQTAAGAMLAVALGDAEVMQRLDDRLSLAVAASPDLSVVSGPPDAIAAFRAAAERDGIDCRPVDIAIAAHSSLMDPVIDRFHKRAAQVTLKTPAKPWVSNVTGTWITTQDAVDPAYWARHLRATVRFSTGIETLLQAHPRSCFLEIGPGRSLASLILRHPRRTGQPVLTSLGSADEPADDEAFMLAAAGDLWTAGATLKPEAIYAGEQRRRVPLPTYPFERKRYWIEPAPGALSGFAQPTTAKRTNVDDWLYLPSWRRTLAPRAQASSDPRDLLFINDRGGIARRVAAHLRAGGHRITELEGDAQPLPPATDIVDFRPCDPLDQGQPAAERLVLQLTALGRSLGTRATAQRLSVISSTAHDITGQEAFDPLKSAALGPVQVIAQEYPDLRCRSIDIAVAEDNERLAERLSAELIGDAGDGTIAWRGPHRWLQEFVPAGPLATPAPLRQGGTYLITGGTGEVGLTIAEYLARNAGARLILTSRNGTLADDALHRLESAGAEVLVHHADAADESAMRDICTEAARRFGRIDGVIHAAGVTADDTVFRGIAETTPEQVAALFRPKLTGTIVLERILRDHPVDFCLLISSNASTLGGLGLAAYSAASHFLDAFAAARRREGLPWISSNWDGWPTAKSGAPGHSHIDRYTMTTTEAEAALARVLAADTHRVVVSAGDLNARLSSGKARPAEAPSSTIHSDHPVITPSGFEAPSSDAERAVAAEFEDLLGIRPIGRLHDFFQLGGDSLVGSRLIARLARQFQIDLSVRALFADPSVAGLAAQVDRQCVAALAPTAPLAADEEEGVL